MIKFALPVAALAALTLAACSGPEEDAGHKQADAAKEQGQAQSNMMEKQADAATDPAAKKALDDQADAAKATGQAQHDAIEKQIDKDH